MGKGRGSVREYDGGWKGGDREAVVGWNLERMGGSGNGERKETLLGSMMEDAEEGNEGTGRQWEGGE